jgi:antirestriction protein ArdC
MTAKNDRPELLAQLEEGIAKLTSSEAWLDYLVLQGRFHRYSFGNALLIAAQNQGATRVAGFQAWRRLDRVVRKGQKAIWILAPMVGKRSPAGGGEEEAVIWGFKYVPVFDIAQTEGADLPTVCTKLSGDDPQNLYGRFLAVAAAIGFRVEDHRFRDTTNGDCSASDHRIRVEIRNSPAQRVKTLAHELAHALLHQQVEDRALAELEAESTAYIVCQQVGLDTSDYSFGYLAVWAGDGTEAIAGIKKSCDRIQKAAATILGHLQDEQEQAA